MAKLIDYKGRLAVDLGRVTNWEKPQTERALSVAPSGFNARDWPHLLGCEVKFTGNIGRVMVPGADRPVWVDTDDWERVVEIEPIKKPRRGRDYDWEWRYGQWRKVW